MLAPLAGGNWNNGSNAGVWAMNLNNDRSNSNTSNGSRAVIWGRMRPSHGPKGSCACRSRGTLVRAAKAAESKATSILVPEGSV